MTSENPCAYCAEILDPSDAEHRARIGVLVSAPNYQVVDALQAQIADLVNTRRVVQTTLPYDLEEAIAAFTRKQGPDYGIWAHYPWARRIVRVLPEADFVWLRTNRNQHKITA
ncbi:MAG: hypothetical protein ABJA62_12365, partial [Luteimonas sp.]